MGRDKALIRVHERPLLLHQLTLLKALCAQTYVSAGDGERYRDLTAVAQIADESPGAGPLWALLGALGRLAADGHDRALVLSCDALGVGGALLEALTEAISVGSGEEGADFAYALDAEDRPQPLIACYRVAVEPTLRQLVANGERRLRVLLQGPLRGVAVAPVGLPRPGNANTPAELEAHLTNLVPGGAS